MSNFKIIGTSNPEVGKEIIYKTSISNLPGSLPGQINTVGNNPFAEQVKWSIYILEYGKWILKEKNNKTGPTAHYTFTAISLKRHGIRIVALLGNEKATLDIKPLDTIERKIVKVELCDALGNLQTKPFGYNQTVLARVHCLNLDNCAVHVTLWEDDAPGAGHNEINKNNKAITKSEMVSNGIADVKFRLAPDFAKMADAQLAKRDKSEGKTHEYYVTAEIFRQETKSSNNIDVTNPNNKTADTKATPQKTVAQKPVTKLVAVRPIAPAAKKGPSKKDEKGILETVTGTIYDWGESKFKAIPTILPDPMEIVNSFAKLFTPDKEDEEKDNKNGICKAEAKVRAFIRMLRVKEDTVGDSGYEKIVGGKSFIKDYKKDWSTHPKIPIYIKRIDDDSTAAGAYQFLGGTYDEIIKNYGKRYKITDFSPESQDKMCLVLMKHYYKKDRPIGFYSKTGKVKEWRKRFKDQQGDIIQFIIDDNIKRAALLSSLCWASLPDSPYGQQSDTYTFADLKIIYDGYLKEELVAPSKELHLKKGFLKEFEYSCCENGKSNSVEGKGWNIDVHLWSDRKEMGYGILILKDDKKNEIWRTIVRAQGFTSKIGKDRAQTFADTPKGVYKFEKWRNDGSTEVYGPNYRLDMTYESGEAKSAGREEIQIHGGRQLADSSPYLWNTGGCLRVFDDAIKKLKNKTEKLESNSSSKESHFINVSDTLKYDLESKKYYIPDDYQKLLKNTSDNNILKKGITNKKYFRNETNYYTDNLTD